MTVHEHVESYIKLALKCYENRVAEVRHEGELTAVDWHIGEDLEVQASLTKENHDE